MVFVILDNEKPNKVLLVKAADRMAVKDRVKLKDTERIIEGFTDREITALDVSSFTIVST